MNQEESTVSNLNRTAMYNKYTSRKRLVVILLFLLIILASIFAINAGSTNLNVFQVLQAFIGRGTEVSDIVIWQIRLPRVLAAIIAGAGLSVAGCVMQNNLRNPLASPLTLGINHAAAFGANVAIVLLGAGSIQSTGNDAVIINNPYLVTVSAFISAIIGTAFILMIRFRGGSPETMILAGVALNSLFSAGIILIQYFANEVQIAAAVFWTFGDLGRASWKEVVILTCIVVMSIIYFMFMRWNYNALDSGDETAKALGVDVGKIRIFGMLVSCMVTAAAVSFFGIIGFVGLVGPQIMRRIVGGDHRFLIPASALAGSLLLLVSDTLARTMIAPVVLPVGAITSFFGAPLFLYILARGYHRK